MNALKAPPPNRGFVLGTLALTLVALVLRLAGLGSQPASIDDFSMGLTAINFVEYGQLGPIMWNHPDLGNLLVYGTLKLLGSGPLGLKGASLATGTLSVTLIALVGRRLLASERAALLGAALWAVDSLSIDLSRQAVHEIYQSFFPLLGVYLVLRFLDRERLVWLVAAGLAFGLGLASKWSALFPLAVMFLFLARPLWLVKLSWGRRLAVLARNAALLGVLPLVVYLMSFLPWFGRGYTLSDWVDLQQSMYLETTTHQSYRGAVTGDFRPIAWFVRPVAWQDLSFGRSEAEATLGEPTLEGNVSVLLALTNPLVWLLVLPAFGFTLVKAWRERSPGLCLAFTLFLASYLPLLAASRPIWLNTAVFVLPFALIMVGYLLARGLGERRWGRELIACYLVLVLLTSVPLYLLATGRGLATPLLHDYVKARLENP